jgi:hypothetical protein
MEVGVGRRRLGKSQVQIQGERNPYSIPEVAMESVTNQATQGEVIQIVNIPEAVASESEDAGEDRQQKLPGYDVHQVRNQQQALGGQRSSTALREKSALTGNEMHNSETISAENNNDVAEETCPG